MSQANLYRVVVGVDFSEAGDHALDQSLRLSEWNDHDEIHFVHVIPRSGTAIDRLESALEDARVRLRERVLERGAALGQWAQDVVFHVRIGEPAAVLHQVAVDVDADLLVVGSHQRAGLAKMVLGSVAQELVQTARVPVLVARAKDFTAMTKTPRPEPATPGLEMHHARVMASEHLHFGKRSPHISGLI
jgi:nucleotide-binding universal stress UspA family protein